MKTKLRHAYTRLPSLLKEGLLFFTLVSFVLLVNLPVFSFNMHYPEQPLIYAANQNIHSFWDLLQVYLHPKMFHVSILFYRPSGHFLMYQLLQPFFGWHNTQAFIFVNLCFLALTCYVLLKLYELLFPNFKIGGYVAIAVYLMHPALMLSRLIVLHFEFAYVFFTTLSLYCFVLFCQRGLRNFYLLAAALSCYAFAVTFKEPALFLGPVFMAYLAFSLYKQQGFSTFLHQLFQDKKNREILLLLMIVTLSLGLYLSLQWPTLHHPLRHALQLPVIIEAFKRLFITTWGLKAHFFAPPVWRNVVFPGVTRFSLGILAAFTLLTTLLVYFNAKLRDYFNLNYKQSLAFLYLACVIFLVLPVCWGWGLPWHLSLSLLFLSLLMGFSTEYLCRRLIGSKVLANLLCFFIAFTLGLTAIAVNQMNIQYITREQGFPLAVGRNAILNPPDLQGQLNAESVLVVEDSRIHDAYLLGASIYPYYFSFKLNSPNLDATAAEYSIAKKTMFIQQQPVYNGTLFRWAYLMPTLHEEVYPFRVEHLEEVPDLILYNWLQHADNIFCLGYDAKAQWQDRSALFRKNLQLEQARRHFTVHHYEALPTTALTGSLLGKMTLPFPEPQLCQHACDQQTQCLGFTYIYLEKAHNSVNECLFYSSVADSDKTFCAACSAYVKIKPSLRAQRGNP